MFTTYINLTFVSKCQTLLFESNHVKSHQIWHMQNEAFRPRQ